MKIINEETFKYKIKSVNDTEMFHKRIEKKLFNKIWNDLIEAENDCIDITIKLATIERKD